MTTVEENKVITTEEDNKVLPTEECNKISSRAMSGRANNYNWANVYRY